MIIKSDPSALRQTKWHEYVLRFVSGGAITVIAGLIAGKWGAVIGGLFLAFPAIFPAGATLLEKHQRERKKNRGLHGEKRSVDVAAVDAAAAALGSLGLVAFAGTCWLGFPRYAPLAVLVTALIAWALVSLSGWFIWKRLPRWKHGTRAVRRGW